MMYTALSYAQVKGAVSTFINPTNGVLRSIIIVITKRMMMNVHTSYAVWVFLLLTRVRYTLTSIT